MGIVITVIVVVVVIALIAFVIAGYNKLKRADIRAQEGLGGIDVQLTRRADLIPNLVNTVSGYATHERAVFDEVTAARANAAHAAQSGTIDQKAQADQRLNRAVANVLAVAENYPDLKASANFAALQNELSDTENKLSFARQYYNDTVARLNQLVQTIPWMFFAGMAGVRTREFYRAQEGQQQPPQVRF
ncbi:LemA family protein [Gordonia jinhuaensis]|uniref:LemA protein n=1 Tax=Gordonia jinhuaensis TaxID=1517702 RepID=A0A916WW26_9ACTN|nr:LemA family protein [Gordonia jinhuaensis]GGB37067.1 LemA protein [Gordonia jinhuaensis]